MIVIYSFITCVASEMYKREELIYPLRVHRDLHHCSALTWFAFDIKDYMHMPLSFDLLSWFTVGIKDYIYACNLLFYLLLFAIRIRDHIYMPL